MSAIAGILYFDKAPVEPGLIEKLTTAMKSRGPDEQTHWVQGSIALGHCMLRTTPESLEEHQPLLSQDKKLAMVWDGRLDNREELQREFKQRGIIPRDISDAELALQSYMVWGEDCPKKLLGDFAFAVWDERQQRLFCARDHMGARPFYYTKNERFFAFASEDEVLLNLPGVSNKPNEERIAYFLVPSFLDFDYAHSWLEDVWSLMPATTTTVLTAGSARKNTYWQLELYEEAKYASDQECQEAFLDVFGEAVRCRMRSSGGVAAMMSGGLDSAGISAMAKRLLPRVPGVQFHTYSAISDHPETCIESQCILSLTRDLGENAHYVSIPSFTGMLNAQDLIEVVWSRAHPVDNSIPLPAMMCLAASRNGQRVMLNGVSGDLTMWVPDLYMACFMRHGQWGQAWRECMGASQNNTYLRDSSAFSLFMKGGWAAFAPFRLKMLMKTLRGRVRGTALSNSVVNLKFARRLGLEPRLRKYWEGSAKALQGHNLVQQHLQVVLPPGVVRGLDGYDRVAGRYGVELRDPWADRRMVDFFLHLPLKHRVRNGWTKWLVRDTFSQDLEPLVIRRFGKEHLGWHFVARSLEEVSRAWVWGMVSAGCLHDYLNGKEVGRLTNKYKTHMASNDTIDICNALTLSSWLQRIARN